MDKNLIKEFCALDPSSDNLERGTTLALELAPIILGIAEQCELSDEQVEISATALELCGHYLWKSFEQNPTADPQLAEGAISAFERCQMLWKPISDPQRWASRQLTVASVYREVAQRLDDENGLQCLHNAIQASTACLTDLIREAAPEGWAVSQLMIGNLHHELSKRRQNEQQHLGQAIQAYQGGLAVCTHKVDPKTWAILQNDLSISLQKLGERQNSEGREEAFPTLRKAVQASEASLTVFTRETTPTQWLSAMNNLARANLSLGERLSLDERTPYLQAAIAAYETILPFCSRHANPDGWARTHICFGDAFQLLGEQLSGDEGIERLHLSIRAFEACLTVWTQEIDLERWAITSHKLALTLESLGKRLAGGEGLSLLLRAKRCHEENLTVQNREIVDQGTGTGGTSVRDSRSWAWANSTLQLASVNDALSDRLECDDALQSLREAIENYTAGLTAMRRASKRSEDWSKWHHALGLALYKLACEVQGNEASSALQQAIQNYHAALSFMSREKEPWAWAATQANLANAYLRPGDAQNRDKGTDCLRLAIDGYDKSLTDLPREAAPSRRREIQKDLVTALQLLGDQLMTAEGLEVLRRQIHLREIYLLQQEEKTQEWAEWQLNFAKALLTLSDRIGGEEGLQYLQRAVDACKTVRTIWTRDTNPIGWAQSNDLLALVQLPISEQQASPEGRSILQQAIECYDLVLTVYTKETFAEEWAGTQTNIATILTTLAEQQGGEEAIQNLRRAIKCCERLSRNAGWALNFCNPRESMEKLTFSWSLRCGRPKPELCTTVTTCATAAI